MAKTQEAMPSIVTWWHKDQVVITFLSTQGPEAKKPDIIKSLNLGPLNDFLKENGFRLESFDKRDVARSSSDEQSAKDDDDNDFDNDDERSREKRLLNSPVGKYLFRPPFPGTETTVISFFHIKKTDSGQNGQTQMNTTSSSEMGSKGGSGMGDMGEYRKDDKTLTVVKLINGNLGEMKRRDIPTTSAMPHWLNGATPFGCGTHGCPVTPPFPVPDTCPSSPGAWPIAFPGEAQLPTALQGRSGSDVTVFVLDTLPNVEQIRAADQGANGNGITNALLHSMADGIMSVPPFNAKAAPPAININYNTLSAHLDTLQIDQPATGKDINGNLIGFPMVDHGLFVAGIIRDLAPDANIECVRVLNDFAAGDTNSLTKTLEDIQERIETGDLQGQRVVINMSLVATPPDEVLMAPPHNLMRTEVDSMRHALYTPIASLAANHNVLFVASAGNDSDLRIPTMGNTTGYRFKVRYPAAFAYPNPSGSTGLSQVIPIGAVDKDRHASSYSNYPGFIDANGVISQQGFNGIATYGGEIPKGFPPHTAGNPSDVTQVDPRTIDGLRGVYSAPYYPRLSKDDPAADISGAVPQPPPEPISPPYPESLAPTPDSAWAYWAGTSFASPIITSLVARFLHNQASIGSSVGDDARQALINAAGSDTTTWDRLGDNASESTQGPLIMAGQQCQQTPPIG